LIGVTIGALVTAEALRRAVSHPVPILVVTLGTLLISLAAGWVLARRRDVSAVTGAFSMIAGGAAGVVAVARDLDADDRVVTVVQYLRVVIVLVAMPLLTTVVFRPDRSVGTLRTGHTQLGVDLGFVLVTVGLGLLLARVVRISTVVLLGPMVVAVVIASAGWLGAVAVPVALQWLAYALVGIQVGLRFTRASLVSIARMLPTVVVLIAGIVALCAGMGVLLSLTSGVDQLTAYLATTPGGLFAVLATAVDTGSDTTFVTAVQLLRLVVILLLTPLIARVLSGPTERPDPAGRESGDGG
jgi:membrane AbrB-like protein